MFCWNLWSVWIWQQLAQISYDFEYDKPFLVKSQFVPSISFSCKCEIESCAALAEIGSVPISLSKKKKKPKKKRNLYTSNQQLQQHPKYATIWLCFVLFAWNLLFSKWYGSGLVDGFWLMVIWEWSGYMKRAFCGRAPALLIDEYRISIVGLLFRRIYEQNNTFSKKREQRAHTLTISCPLVQLSTQHSSRAFNCWIFINAILNSLFFPLIHSFWACFILSIFSAICLLFIGPSTDFTAAILHQISIFK